MAAWSITIDLTSLMATIAVALVASMIDREFEPTEADIDASAGGESLEIDHLQEQDHVVMLGRYTRLTLVGALGILRTMIALIMDATRRFLGALKKDS